MYTLVAKKYRKREKKKKIITKIDKKNRIEISGDVN